MIVLYLYFNSTNIEIYFRFTSDNENKFTMIKDRVIQLIENKGVGKEEFFGLIGMTSANFRGNARKTPLNSNAIENILSFFPDVNVEWLITGNGLMFSKNEIRIPDSEPVPEGMVKTFMDMIDRKDQKIIELSEEIGKLKNEVSILKKQGKQPANYLSVAEP